MTDAPLRTRLTTASPEAAIVRVTVYRDRAEVVRHVRLTKLAPQRTHEIVVSRLPDTVDEQSLRVSGGVGPATILEVVYSQRTERMGEGGDGNDDEGKRLHAERDDVNEQLSALRDELAVVEQAAEWLHSLAKSLATKPSDADKAAATKMPTEFLEYYMRETKALAAQKRALLAQQAALQKKLQALQHEINRRSSRPTEIVREVTILLDVGSGGASASDGGDKKGADEADVDFELIYTCNNARWSARYDCRVTMQPSAAQLTYYGEVVNQTGEAWNAITLSLSTAMPSVGGQPPELPTAYARFHQPVEMYRNASMKKKRGFGSGGASLAGPPGAAMMVPQMQQANFYVASSLDEEEEAGAPPPPPVAVSTAEVSGSTSASFTIPRPATIASDNDAHKVTIAVLTLKPGFTHVAVPRLNTSVFIKATVTNDSEFPLLPGPLAVYMDGSYVCTTSIDAVSPREEFAIFLGMDAAVKVTYAPAKIMREQVNNFIGSAKGNVETSRFETTIKNNKTTSIAMLVYDQIPLADDGKIQVRVKEPKLPPAEAPPGWHIKLNPKNNVEWRVPIAAGAEVTLPLIYTIEWPLHTTLAVQRE